MWTIEKLENKLIDMRDLYQEWKEKVPEVLSIFSERDQRLSLFSFNMLYRSSAMTL